MEWIIKIEDKKDRRILVVFDAMHESIKFIGQFKAQSKDMVNSDIKNGFIWADISEDQHQMKITLDELTECVRKVYDKMDERLAVQEDLAKVFTVLKSVKITKEEV